MLLVHYAYHLLSINLECAAGCDGSGGGQSQPMGRCQ